MMMKHKLTFFIFIHVIALFYANPALSYQNNINSIGLSEKEFSNIGYKTTKTHKYSRLCSGYEKTSPDKVHYQGIKSTKPIKGYSNTYYRFTLIKEVYEDKAIASTSFKKITQLKANSWYSKNCALKQGVQIKNTLYFLSTDAGMFSSKLDTVLEKIIAQITMNEQLTSK